MTILIFFILGLIIGSFLNVVVYRLNLLESVMGRSYCPHCKAKVRWYDNVPLLSFLALSAKCRDCGEKISWQYPIVEFFTGIVFAFVGTYVFSVSDTSTWIESIYYLGAFSALMVVFVYDFKFMEISMLVLWTAVIWTIGFLIVLDWINYVPGVDLISLRTFSGLIAGIGAFLFFFALSAGSKEKWMGMGDAYVALLTGLIVGWPYVLGALMSAFTIGALFGIVLILMKKKTMQSQVPFAPFIVLGIFIAVFVPRIFPMIKYYFMIFG
jgi:prepilin signal peptidase PulO-like enzyme (type II secretory pathway)